MSESKPIHVKPSMYAYFFYDLKEIALEYGYNLVLHGSMNRDLDLIAIPWQKELKSYNDMIDDFAKYLDGNVMQQSDAHINCFPHGRKSAIINLNRGRDKDGNDLQYYLDISIIPTQVVDPYWFELEYQRGIEDGKIIAVHGTTLYQE